MARREIKDRIDPLVIVTKAPPDIREMFRDRSALQAAQQQRRIALARQNNFLPTRERPFLPED